MDVMSNLLGVYSNVRSDAISPMVRRGLRMSLIQTQDSAPNKPDPTNYVIAGDVDPVPDTGYPNPFNLPY